MPKRKIVKKDDAYNKKIANKIKRRFLKSPKGNLIYKISKDKRLYICYMYGGTYGLTKKERRKGKVVTTEIIIQDTLKKVTKRIVEEKQETTNPIYNKLSKMKG